MSMPGRRAVSSSRSRDSLPIGIAILLAAAFVRLFFAWQPIDRIDRLFVPDDTYYTLAIARSIAHGIGPSADGTTLTNGFQPLLGFLLVPVFWITSDPDMALRAAVVLTAVVDALSVFLIFRIANRAWGRAAGVAGAALWTVSPYAIANALGGLETSLAVFCVLLLVDTMSRSRESPTSGTALWLGALGAIAWLARIDTAAATLLLFIACGPARLRYVGRAALAFMLVVGPWCAYELIRFGTIIPESGSAVRAQVAFHQALYLTTSRQAAWAAGYLTTAPFIELRGWRDWLFDNDWAGLLTFACGWLGAAALLARNIVRRARVETTDVIFASGLVVAAFYVVYVPALWFFRRYLAPAELALTFAWAAAVAVLWHRNTYTRLLASCIVVLAIGTASLTYSKWMRIDPDIVDVALEGSKGYREPALLLLRQVPADARIGALQSGALAYYAPPSIDVVNLDGVVDRAAHRAVVAEVLRDYARSRDVQWFGDWPFNRDAWAFFSRRAATPEPFFEDAWHGPSRGSDRTVLWRVRWRDVNESAAERIPKK